MKKWFFPLYKELLGPTSDSDSFKNINVSTQVEVPTAPHVGSFGIERRHDVHKGVDLYANVGERVYAVEDGIISLIRPFTGKDAGCDWWLDTDAINISGASGVAVYGEIHFFGILHVGMKIKRGQYLGFVKRVLKNDKGRPTSMLHFALHKPNIQGNGTWKVGEKQPDGLLDPTELLLSAEATYHKQG
jgi:hypothetical protein